jgi:Winged helix-turn helix
MTTDKKVARRKLSLSELASDLGNVSKACRVMGYSRQQFYEIRRNFQTYGADGLLDRLPGARGPHPNRALYTNPDPGNTRGWSGPSSSAGTRISGWREHCEHLRDRKHELRDRLAYTPPYSEERGRLEDPASRGALRTRAVLAPLRTKRE